MSRLIAPWLSEYVALARQHTELYLKLTSDGRDVYVVNVSADPALADGVLGRVVRGALHLNAVNKHDRPHVYYRLNNSAGLISTQDGSALADPAAWVGAVDGVPWEIHKIEDPEAWAAARDAFIAAQADST